MSVKFPWESWLYGIFFVLVYSLYGIWKRQFGLNFVFIIEVRIFFHAYGLEIKNTNSLCDRISENFDKIGLFYLTLFIEQYFQNLHLISYFEMILMCLRSVRQFPSIKISDNFWLSF